MACRCPKRAKDAVEWLKEATGGKEAIFLHLDLADLESVRAAATEFTRYVDHLLDRGDTAQSEIGEKLDCIV